MAVAAAWTAWSSVKITGSHWRVASITAPMITPIQTP